MIINTLAVWISCGMFASFCLIIACLVHDGPSSVLSATRNFLPQSLLVIAALVACGPLSIVAVVYYFVKSIRDEIGGSD